VMVFLGLFLGAVFLYSVYMIIRKKPAEKMFLFRFFPLLVVVPYLTNASGWILTEMGRQPWVVFGLLRTVDGVSGHSVGALFITLIGFALVYGVLLVVDVWLLLRFARLGPQDDTAPAAGAAEMEGEYGA